MITPRRGVTPPPYPHLGARPGGR